MSLYQKDGAASTKGEQELPVSERARQGLGFTKVSNATIRDPELSMGEKLTLIALLSYAWQDCHCYPSVKTVARDVGCSERSVNNYLAGLEKKGRIFITHRRNQTNVYRFSQAASGAEPAGEGVQNLHPTNTQEEEYSENHSVGDEQSPPQRGIDSQGEEDNLQSAEIAVPSYNAISAGRKTAKGFVTKLVRDLELTGHHLDEDQKGRAGRNFKALTQKGIEDHELHRVVARMVSEWPRFPLSPQQALSDLRGSTRDGHGSGTGFVEKVASPEPAIQALKDHEVLSRFVGAAKAFDFTGDEDPPFKVLARLGGDEGERQTILKRMRSVCRRAVRQAKEAEKQQGADRRRRGYEWLF